jgi:hypothetical protein
MDAGLRIDECVRLPVDNEVLQDLAARNHVREPARERVKVRHRRETDMKVGIHVRQPSVARSR